MDSLNPLETQLVELEEDIRETIEEIDRQKDVVRNIGDPFERRYAEHVLATYEEHQKVVLADHYQLSKRLAEIKAH
jgi:predicted metal-dependent phosphoesterase TrpH